MKKTLIILILTGMLLSASGCRSGQVKQLSSLPEVHPIGYDATLSTLGDEYGADLFNHALDHPDTRYYTINDYYNLTSGDGLHILPHFQTYQQTTEYSCGPASALMVLYYYGNHEFNELDICRLAGTDMPRGTSVEGLAGFFDSLGWDTAYHADTDCRFQSVEECESFFLSTLDSGAPIMVDWVDWEGHWQVVIGLDTCNTDNPNDDVLIMADPYDITDHYQDGYYIVPLGRFYKMWREGLCAGKTDPYLQPFLVATPVQESKEQ